MLLIPISSTKLSGSENIQSLVVTLNLRSICDFKGSLKIG